MDSGQGGGASVGEKGIQDLRTCLKSHEGGPKHGATTAHMRIAYH